MTRALAAAVLILVVALIVAVEAPGAKKPTFATAARVAALEAKVTKLTKTVTSLNSFVSTCVVPVPLALRGNPTAGEGYVYRSSAGETVRESLDLAAQGDGTVYVFAGINNECLEGMRPASRAAFRTQLQALRAKR